ncbi:MAG TPA: PilZ domain-containing protein [Polyangiaceae bacterium]
MELRRFVRVPLDQTVVFALKGEDAFSDGLAKDISLGGMFVATEFVPPFGAEVTVHLALVDGEPELVLPAIVRWTRPDGMGLQFQLLGARETFAITEVVRLRGEGR